MILSQKQKQNFSECLLSESLVCDKETESQKDGTRSLGLYEAGA